MPAPEVEADDAPITAAVKTDAPAISRKQFASDQEAAATTPERDETFRGRLKEFFAPLRGSHEVLVRQNERAVQDGNTRIEDEDDIRRQVAARTLVPLPVNANLTVDPRLPVERRYTRPWTARFLRDISSAFAESFGGSALQVNSAVRTADFQRRLIRVNGNAAAVDGDAASPHLYGGVIDIGKRGMTTQQINWMRGFLTPLVAAGKLDVEEEFKQACFHISVYKSYMPVVPKQQLARASRPPAPAAASVN